MHLIMNALEEVTSCAHPNVSEISLLITLVSVSMLSLNLPKKKKIFQIKETQKANYCAHHSSSVPAVLHEPGFSFAPSEDAVNTSQLPAAFLLW